MKKLILSTLFLIGIFGILHAQHHKVELYPTSFIFQEITMEYEFIPKATILGFGTQITGAINATVEKYSGVMIAPFFKLYFTRDASRKLNAWYVKPTFYVGAFHGDNVYYHYYGTYNIHNASVDFNPLGVALLFGKQWTFSSGFSIDLAFGLRYFSRNNIPESVEVEISGDRFKKTYDLESPVISSWLTSGPGRFWDVQFGVSYVFPTHAKKFLSSPK